MENITLYLALEQSILVTSPTIKIGDMSTVFCKDKSVDKKVRELEVTSLPSTGNSQIVITVMKLIEIINTQIGNIDVKTIGCPETIVYYNNKKKNKLKTQLKAGFLMILAFFGTAYSIMAYNEDVDSAGLLDNLYTLFTGNTTENSPLGFILGNLSYSIGLAIGMIIFFNHGINSKNADDPSPLQVQMRLYEQDVNTCIVIDSSRNNKTLDVS